MKWEGNRQSDNVEDRRATGAGTGGGGGSGIGLGGLLIAFVAWAVFGINPATVLNLLSGAPATSASAPAARAPAQDRDARFVSVVLASTEDAWQAIFSAAGAQYKPPRLVLYRGVTPTACGTGQSAMGPFYCPGDQKVYLDLDFFDTLSRRLGAPGEFARAYVIAHEVGHHVQTLQGTTRKVSSLRDRLSAAEYNAMQVRLELQADCYAGLWARHSQQARQWLQAGDIESAINAAGQIGDDHLQQQHSGVVRPETFTHGSSAQRQRWFMRGFETGRVSDCNTFGAAEL